MFMWFLQKIAKSVTFIFLFSLIANCIQDNFHALLLLFLCSKNLSFTSLMVTIFTSFCICEVYLQPCKLIKLIKCVLKLCLIFYFCYQTRLITAYILLKFKGKLLCKIHFLHIFLRNCFSKCFKEKT